MVDLNEFDQLKSESSSVGNQMKFSDGLHWYKLDNIFCYEGLAEEFTSRFADCIYDFPHVQYQVEEFQLNGVVARGCKSQCMLSEGQSFWSFKSIFEKYEQTFRMFIQFPDVATNIQNVADFIGKVTGLDVLQYIGRLLLFDSLICNEDRHWSNFGVLYNSNGSFGIAPCFDNGSSLLCVNWSYKSNKDFEWNCERLCSSAKPFSKFFDRQVEACEKLGVEPLRIDEIRLGMLLREYECPIYPESQVSLVKRLLKHRLEYYKGKGVYELV